MQDDNLVHSIETDFASGVSTYALITIERILWYFGFALKPDEIIKLLKNKDNVYYHFLRVPFSNILNDIIISQIEGYREFVQKIFIDYLLSGSGNETEEQALDGSAKESLEEERKYVIEIGQTFDLVVFDNNSLLAESQKALIKLAKDKFKNLSKVTEEDNKILTDTVDSYECKSKELYQQLRVLRKNYQDVIVTIQSLIVTLPDYNPDQEKMMRHRESILFDTDIGSDDGN